jgi:hypothetical protein
MTNYQRQKKLDEQKYLVSEAKKEDQSGNMPYCDYCNYSYYKQSGIAVGCEKPQNEREENCLCATAYNRMIRARK